MFFEEEMCPRFEFNMCRIHQKQSCGKMLSQPIRTRTHIVLECDGSGNMLSVFSDSVDRLKWVLGVKIDTGHEIHLYQF